MARAKASAPADDRSTRRFRCDDEDYHRWRTTEIVARDRALAVVSKPGVPSFGELDPAEALLLDYIDVARADNICDLNCGTGVVGAFAALTSPRAHVSLRAANILSVEAARRTLAANDAANVRVTFGREDASAPWADVAIVRIPKGRLPLLQLLWDAFHVLRPGGRCYIAGGNDEGIKPALRLLEELFGNAALVAYRGGHRIGSALRPDAPAQPVGDFDVPWRDPDHFQSIHVDTGGHRIEVCSRPGVFSWDRLDRGTHALLDAMVIDGAARIIDLGCGAGIIGVAAALRAPAAHVTLLDASWEAVRASTRTVAANGLGNRCDVIAGDVAAAIPDRTIDVVLANPPFHTGKATDLDIAAQFIRDAARVLTTGGRLFLVANRTLPYEAWLRKCFGSHETVFDGREFKVLSARRR